MRRPPRPPARVLGGLLLAAGLALPFADAGTAMAGDDSQQAVRARCLAEAQDGNWRNCEIALALAQDDLALRRALGRALMIGGEYERAVQTYEKIVADHPERADSHYELAGVLGSLNRFVEAEGPVLRALELLPDHRKALQLAAIVYNHMRQPERALPYTRRLAERGDRLAMFDLARYYERGTGVAADPGKAFAWFRRAAEAGHVGAMDRMTVIHLEGGLSQPVDREKGAQWAARARAARRE